MVITEIRTSATPRGGGVWCNQIKTEFAIFSDSDVHHDGVPLYFDVITLIRGEWYSTFDSISLQDRDFHRKEVDRFLLALKIGFGMLPLVPELKKAIDGAEGKK
jgi:hypothetical protein